MNNVFIRISAVLILGMSWVIAWQQILYAARLPGDSFTASVFLLIAVMLQFVVRGRQEASAGLPIHVFFRGMLLGLFLLALVMTAPMLVGKNMMEPLKVTFAGREWSTTMLFETAVFLIIVGVVTTALVTFKEPD